MSDQSYATIVFKSGASIDVDVKSISSSRNNFSGALIKVEWEHHPNAQRRILTLNLENVDAIVFHDPTGTESEAEADAETAA
jgi:uncharacterized protein YdgA (DUF945 family)